MPGNQGSQLPLLPRARYLPLGSVARIVDGRGEERRRNANFARTMLQNVRHVVRANFLRTFAKLFALFFQGDPLLCFSLSFLQTRCASSQSCRAPRTPKPGAHQFRDQFLQLLISWAALQHGACECERANGLGHPSANIQHIAQHAAGTLRLTRSMTLGGPRNRRRDLPSSPPALALAVPESGYRQLPAGEQNDTLPGVSTSPTSTRNHGCRMAIAAVTAASRAPMVNFSAVARTPSTAV